MLLFAILQWLAKIISYFPFLKSNNPIDNPTPTPVQEPLWLLDLSHHDGAIDYEAVRKAGVVGVFLKATQGVSEVDPLFGTYRKGFANVGILVGAYHFGTGDNVQSQVDHFLKTTAPHNGIALALDFESNPKGTTMNLIQAHYFVAQVHQQLGRWPKFYIDKNNIETHIGAEKDVTLGKCQLWMAEYAGKPIVPGNTWDKQWLWQCSQRGTCAGIVGHVDSNFFYGTMDQLKQSWV